MNTDSIIKACEINRNFSMGDQSLQVLRGISLQVERGEWLTLTGPSGSGKSTLLGLLAGIDQPSSGQLWLGGIRISGMPENKLARLRNQEIGIVFQSFHLIPSMTALENVEMPLYISPLRRNARQLARETLELVGLVEREKHLPGQLSGGEQQRVAIARALVTKPNLLLADEPTGNLDSATGRLIMNLIVDLRKRMGLTVIMVTHDPQVAKHADRVINMVDGRLVPPQVELVSSLNLHAEVIS